MTPVPREIEQREETVLAEALIAMTPGAWSALRLDVGVQRDSDRLQMPHMITSPEGHREPVLIARDPILAITKRMWDRSSAAGCAWLKMTMLVYFSDGNWAYRVNYTYDERS